MIDLVDGDLVHAPATAGGRFSAGGAIFDKGGKSAD
jgi:hypothetical protein